MSVPAYRRNRFDTADEEPMGPLANLADIMLVFAVGLMVALAAANEVKPEGAEPQGGTRVEAGREIPELPTGLGEAGSGYESVGRVYRDPDSGRLILIDDN